MQLDDAYSNAAYIPGGNDFPVRWAAQAAAFRDRAQGQLDIAYGPDPREVLDLFEPKGAAAGVFVFVHGGYWMEGDKSLWSHLAAGALAQGWAVAIPSYPLCPQVRIGEITQSISAAIAAAADLIPGPIRLAGHSAGGHLVARMACDDMDPAWRDRVSSIVAISPLSDLAPLRMTSMNSTLGIDADESFVESPISHARVGVDVTVWVGADERPAFLDQARWLADLWRCGHVIEPGRHHFDVIDGLMDAKSALCRTLWR